MIDFIFYIGTIASLIAAWLVLQAFIRDRKKIFAEKERENRENIEIIKEQTKSLLETWTRAAEEKKHSRPPQKKLADLRYVSTPSINRLHTEFSLATPKNIDSPLQAVNKRHQSRRMRRSWARR